MSEEQFWHSNPKKLEPYIEAYRLRMFEEDRQAHKMGSYIYDAVCSALSGFGKKPHTYRDKPYLAEQEERHRIEMMDENEKFQKVEQVFEMLGSLNS